MQIYENRHTDISPHTHRYSYSYSYTHLGLLFSVWALAKRTRLHIPAATRLEVRSNKYIFHCFKVKFIRTNYVSPF